MAYHPIMIYEFKPFTLNLTLLELTGPEGVISLEPKSFALLAYLVKHHNQAVSKEAILENVWPDVFVSDASLATAIKQIRHALGDDGNKQDYIKTLRGYGYRFVADVKVKKNTYQLSEKPEPTEQHMVGKKPTIAVCPFVLFGADASNQAIAEAIPSELIASLSKLRWINVIARGSSFKFDQQRMTGDQFGQKVGADYIVTGVVEWAAQTININVILSDTEKEQVIWSDRKVAPFSQIFEMRSDIARELAMAVESRIPTFEADNLIFVPSQNLDSWGHFHLGVRHVYRYNRDDNEAAAYHFQQAIKLDPTFARAYGGLSYTEFQNTFQHFGADTDHHRDLALKYAEKAVDLDPLDPFCNLNFGRSKWLRGEVEEGLDWINKSLDLNPNYAFAYYNNSTLNTVLCNSQIADDNIERALSLSPIDPHLQSMFGTRALAAFVHGNLQAASSYADKAVNAANPHLYVFMIAAVIYNHLGNGVKAEACIQAIKKKNVPFGKKDFFNYFNLKNQDSLNIMRKALEPLDI